MSSTRLPGKVLEDLHDGRRTLDLVLERLRRAREAAALVLATSDEPADDPVAARADDHGVTVVRGPLYDVLERYRLAAAHIDCDAIVRITADCPLVDAGLVDHLVALWRSTGADYVANVREPRSFPKGLDVEVLSTEALLAAAAEAHDAADREHVTPYIRARPERFPAQGVWLSPPHPDIRLTLDTRDDLAALRALIADIGPSAELPQILRGVGIVEYRLVDRPT